MGTLIGTRNNTFPTYRTEFVGAGAYSDGAEEKMYEIRYGEEVLKVLGHLADILMKSDAFCDPFACIHRLISSPILILGNPFQIILQHSEMTASMVRQEYGPRVSGYEG